MNPTKCEHYHERFQHENATTTWKYGVFQQLIEAFCAPAIDLQLVEIGVARGGHSRHLLDNFGSSIKHLHGVDPYIHGYDNTDEFSAKSQEEMDYLYCWVHSYCKDPKFTLLRSSSLYASCLFQNESIDAIYIDGDHSHVGVSTDIKAWLPKIKQGGLIAGDDFDHFAGTRQAVTELLPQYELSENDTWYFKKCTE